MKRLENKVTVITGAASGIGFAVAKLFVQQGARVLLVDRNIEMVNSAASEINEQDHKAAAYQVNVTNEQEIQRMLDHVLATFGDIDILVNAAGIFEVGTITETSLDSWNRVIAVNLTGTFLCSKAVVPSMIRKRGGSIINFSSSTGAYHATKNATAYIASKGGISALTRALAVDYAEYNIRTNAICPGPTNTPILAGLTPDKLSELQSKIPLERLAEPREIANTALFLASDESSFITGAMISVDGGQTINL